MTTDSVSPGPVSSESPTDTPAPAPAGGGEDSVDASTASGADPSSGGGSGAGTSAEVGRVAGTDDATPLKFHVAVGPESFLQLDDVVVTHREVPGMGTVTTSGVVTEVVGRHEGANFGSDVFLIASGVMPAHVQEIAEISTTRVDPECYVPPLPGSSAARATGAERDAALYFDGMDYKLPAGTGRDGQPIYINFEFLNGERGAHVSISGISGVATKTSYALFLLHSVFTSGALGAAAPNAKALVFSVKGEDLLFLDKTNANLDDALRAKYARLGLPAQPFQSVGFFAPPMPGDPNGRPHVTGRTSGVQPFWWTLQQFCAGELMPYVFADPEDERSQYTMVIHQVTAKLKRDATPAGIDGAISIDGTLITTWAALIDFLTETLSDEHERRDWVGSITGIGSINAFLRRLQSSQRYLTPLVRGDLSLQSSGPGTSTSTAPHEINTGNQQVTVVDLHNLHERAQRFVVGVTLAAETKRKEDAGPGSLLFTMLDELNKYAPREGNSPIKDTLLDIAERGRSLGIILIGAQQTASEIERRIISNSSIKIVGRLDPAEAGRPEYGFLPTSQRQRATLAKPGTMFIAQPEIPVPLAVEFPFPAWATRIREVAAGENTPGGAGTPGGPSSVPGGDPSPAAFATFSTGKPPSLDDWDIGLPVPTSTASNGTSPSPEAPDPVPGPVPGPVPDPGPGSEPGSDVAPVAEGPPWEERPYRTGEPPF